MKSIAARSAQSSAARSVLLGLAWICVFALTAFSVANRIRLTQGLELFDPHDGTCFFATEGALQFRYARMVALGERIPDQDPLVQAPQGIHPREVLCLLLENCAGQSYRAFAGFLGKPPIHVWCAFFPHVVAGLGTIAAFLAGRVVWQSLAAGVLAAALYAFSLAGTARSLGAFGHEDFALPWIFFVVACLLGIAESDSRRKIAILGAGLVLSVVLALGAWHFSRFALALVAGSVGVAAVFARKEERGRLFHGAGLLVLGALLAVALFPVLRPHAAGEESAFGHVFALFAAKLRFLNRKPLDPSLLSPEARSLWVEDFDGPSLYLSILMFAVPAMLAVWALMRRGRYLGMAAQASPSDMRVRSLESATGPRGAPFLLLLALLVFTGASYFLVKRLFVLFVFPLAVTAGGAALAALPGSAERAVLRRGRRPGNETAPGASKKILGSRGTRGSFTARQLGIAALLLGALTFEAHKVQSFGGETPASRALRRVLPGEEVLVLPHWQLNERVLVDWILRHTKPNDLFVGRVSTSAVILADAGRPVVLHPKYEVPGVRERSREFSGALYESEEALWKFCTKYGAHYYVHEPRLALEAGDDSERYVGDALPLSKRSAAFRLQFAAEASQHFRLVFRNSSFALFEVLGEAEGGDESIVAKGDALFADGGGPLYDIDVFGSQTLEGESFDDDHTKPVVVQLQEAVEFYSRGRVALAAKQFDAAIPAFEEALRRYPTLLGLNTSYGIALARKGDFQAGLPFCLREVALSPDLALAHSNLGYILGNLGEYDAALGHFDRAIELQPDDPGARAMRAQVAEVAKSAIGLGGAQSVNALK